MARVTLPSWRPRFPNGQYSRILGDSLSTLYVFKDVEGCVGFSTHAPIEMWRLANHIETEFEITIEAIQ